MPSDNAWSISQLAGEFDISTRTVRFYEEKGLLAPARSSGGQRLYSRRDRVRLKLILRGKRFGFTLEQIADMIGLATDDIDEKEQIRRTLRYADRSLGEIRDRITELKLFEAEVLDMRKKMQMRLKLLDTDGNQ